MGVYSLVKTILYAESIEMLEHRINQSIEEGLLFVTGFLQSKTAACRAQLCAFVSLFYKRLLVDVTY